MAGSARQGGYYMAGEIPALAEPWNLARDRAFDRLRQEAELAGADGVIGIEINAGSVGDAANVEMVVFGTAVRETTLAGPAGDGVEGRPGDRPLGCARCPGRTSTSCGGSARRSAASSATRRSSPCGSALNSSWAMNSAAA